MEYVRYCINCGAKKVYKNLDSFRANKNSLLCRRCARTKLWQEKYPNKIEKLLEDTPEAYYWIGYLLADGHFNDNNRIKFTQNNEDKPSVERFKNFVESVCDVKYTNISDDTDCASFSIMNVDVVPKIIDKFDIKSSKTYCPPNLKIFEDMDIDLLAYLFIGFVDGDGHIANLHNRPDFNIRIKLHSSWLNVLKIFETRLFGITGHTKIDKEGYAVFMFGDSQILKEFKKKYILNIGFEPLKRKWDIINLDYVGKYEQSKIRFQKVKELYEQGCSVKDICEKLNLKEGLVYKNLRKIRGLSKRGPKRKE